MVELMRNIFIFAILITIIATTATAVAWILNPPDKYGTALNFQNIQTPTAISSETNPLSPNASSSPFLPPALPDAMNTEVPFTSQAPFGIWDYIHEEACEEASITMVYAWSRGLALTPTLADQEIHKQILWEEENQIDPLNTSATTTAAMAQALYGLSLRILTEPNIKELQKELTDGNIITLGVSNFDNAYFRGQVPYHMVVLRGYDETGFFVNDPGTRYGKNYHYSYEYIMDRAHDWGGSLDTLEQTPAIAVVFEKL